MSAAGVVTGLPIIATVTGATLPLRGALRAHPCRPRVVAVDALVCPDPDCDGWARVVECRSCGAMLAADANACRHAHELLADLVAPGRTVA